MRIAERTPEAVLDFWLGPMRDIERTTEDNWRNGMLKWRVGVFARGAEDPLFREAQREWCEAIHLEGVDRFFADPVWSTRRGVLAKTLVLDQFPRCVYRGTPVAYETDPLTQPLLARICDEGWDLSEFNEVERMWVYVALSHPERRAAQELSVEKWTQWSRDLVAASPPALRKTNQHVSWYFIKSIVEHAEAVLIFGRFPHRNPIMSRPHKAGEVYYLTDPMRPLWSFTQPPRPDYFAILGALCRIEEGMEVSAVPREALAALHRAAGVDAAADYSAMDVFDLVGAETVPYMTLYRHLRLGAKRQTFDAFRRASVVDDLAQRVTRIILKDPNDEWPPKSAKHSVPAVIDVPALNEVVRCPSFATGDLTVTFAAVKRLAADMGLRPIPPEALMARFEALCRDEPRLFRPGPDGTTLSAPLGKSGFQKLAASVFSEAANLEKTARRLYDVIDIDYDHSITSAEALMGLSLFCPGGGAVRARLAFDMFDRDGDGALDRAEMGDMLRTIGLRGIHVIENLFDPYMDPADGGMAFTFEAVRHYDEIEAAAELAFVRADANDDGKVSRAEFEAWAADHAMMRQFLGVANLLFEGIA